MSKAAIVASALLTGCTVMQPIQDFSPSRIKDNVEVGSHVLIVAMNGATYDFTVTQVADSALFGTNEETGKRYKIEYEAIRSIEVEEASGWKIATGLGATITTIIVVAIIAFFAAF